MAYSEIKEKWDIYCIYGFSSCYMQQYSPSTSDFFRPRPAASDEKNPRSRGYIAVYSPPRPHIYITYIPVFLPQISILIHPSGVQVERYSSVRSLLLD